MSATLSLPGIIHPDSQFSTEMLHFILHITCASISQIIAASEPTVTVKLQEGIIRGQLETSDGGSEYYSFYGIPYALPPTGSRRFMKPEPIRSWKGIVGGEIVECAQENSGREDLFNFGGKKLRGREDCLVTNIYTPATKFDRDDLPVIVFVHGGGYFAGSASPGVYGPEYIMDHDVILVTVNYRLGPFGFLSLGDDTIPGNQGLWDLAEALSFIRRNIQTLGGDSEKITLVGHSAGAMAVQFLMLKPGLKGMFRAAILQSGPAISAYSCSDRHPAYYTRTLAGALGCNPSANSSQIVSCLKSVEPEDIVKFVRIMDQKPDVVKNAPNPWKPIFDGLFLSESEAFVAGDPYKLLMEGKVHDIPVIIGHTKDEGLYAVTEAMSRNPEMPEVIFKEWTYKRGPGYLFGREEDGVNDQEQEVAREFFEKFLKNGKSHDPKVLQNMFGPSIWTFPTLVTAELLSLSKVTPTFLYYYTHPGSLSLSDLLSFPMWKLLLKMLASVFGVDIFPNTYICSTHFDEIFIMFKGRNIPFLQRHTMGDKFVGDVLLKLWINFAKNLIPVIESENQKILWRPFHASHNREHLVLSENITDMQDLTAFNEIFDFFRNVYKLVPPSIHLWRSPSWKNDTLYAKYDPYTAHIEL